MHDIDCAHRFVFEHFPIRGYLVHLDTAWRALLEHHAYPAGVRDVLGKGLVASVLLAATIKFDGQLTLQMQGEGYLNFLLAQCTSGLGIRGLARYRDAENITADESVLGQGTLTVTIESEDLQQRYQGIVPVAGGSLAEALQVYFAQSEQLPTRLWLHADERGASGMLLQRLPDMQADQVYTTTQLELVDDAWRRVQLIGDTLQPQELQFLTDREILRRLFHEDDVRLFASAPVFFRCRCSRERVSGILQAMGTEDINALLAERGKVEVNCDFCNRTYYFDAIDIAQLFAVTASSDSRHTH